MSLCYDSSKFDTLDASASTRNIYKVERVHFQPFEAGSVTSLPLPTTLPLELCAALRVEGDRRKKSGSHRFLHVSIPNIGYSTDFSCNCLLLFIIF